MQPVFAVHERGGNQHFAGKSYNPEMLSGFQCASCGEWNDTSVDETAGPRQYYVEDCQVCCKPNVLLATWNRGDGEVMISAAPE